MWEDSIPTYINENGKNVISVSPSARTAAIQPAGTSRGMAEHVKAQGHDRGTPRRGQQMYTP